MISSGIEEHFILTQAELMLAESYPLTRLQLLVCHDWFSLYASPSTPELCF